MNPSLNMPQDNQIPINGLIIPDFVTQPLSAHEMARRREIAAAWAVYKGQFDPPLKKRDGKSAAPENTLSNRCAPIVNTGRDFLFGERVKFEIGDPEDDASPINETDITQANKAIKAAWGDDDDKMTLLAKVAMNGAVCGHAFVRLMPNPNPAYAPRIVNLDPQTVTVITDDDDCETVLAYIIEYEVMISKTLTLTKRLSIWRIDPDGNVIVDGGYDEDSTWMMQAFTRFGSDTKLVPDGDPILWPYPFAPIIDCQNMPNPNEFWGLGDLPKHLIDLNNALNFSQSNTSKILRFHAHPKTIMIGADAAQLQSGPEDVTCLPEGATAVMLEMHGDLASSMAFQDNLRADMDEQSGVPAVALGRIRDIPLGNVSGIALQLLFKPLVQKTMIKQRLYGRLIREICRRLLALMDVMDYDPYLPVEIHWPNLLPVDDLASVQTAQGKQTLGISNATLLAELGYDPEQEMQKSADEDAAKAALNPIAQTTQPLQPVANTQENGMPNGQPAQSVTTQPVNEGK